MNDNYLLYIKLFTFPKGMPTALLYSFILKKTGPKYFQTGFYI